MPEPPNKHCLPLKANCVTSQLSVLPDGPVLMRVNEVASVMGVDVTTIHEWLKADLFPKPVRPYSNQPYWVRSALDEYLKDLHALALAKSRNPPV